MNKPESNEAAERASGSLERVVSWLLSRSILKFNVVGGSTWNARWCLQIGFTRFVWLRTRKHPVGDGPEWWLAAPEWDGKKMRYVRRKWGRRPMPANAELTHSGKKNS